MSGGHGGHGDAGDEIVLHQEKLLPTMLIAVVFAVITLFGLSQAGHTKIDIAMGEAAYQKILSQKPVLEKEIPMSTPTVNYKKEEGKAAEEHPKEEAKTENTNSEEHK